MAKYPAKDVASWLGNTVAVAMKHYAMRTEEAFQKASAIENPLETDATEEAPNRGCICGCISGLAGAIGQGPPDGKTPISLGETGVLIVEDSLGNHYLMGDTGFEPVTSAV